MVLQPETFRESWEESITPICTGTCSRETDASFAFSPDVYYLLGVLDSGSFSALGISVRPTSGLRCTASARVSGGGAFASVRVRLEVIERQTLDVVLTGATVDISLDQFWTAVSGAFDANGEDLVVRLSLLGQDGGANVAVDDIDVVCQAP